MFKTMALVAVAAFGLFVTQENDAQPDLTGVKCVVNGDQAANAEFSADYLDGKAYFCCQRCVAKFEADQKLEQPSLTLKANHQLVVSGQYIQSACPISGEAIVAEQTATVGGVEVGFCCEHCTNKVNEVEDLNAKAELVFSGNNFAKAFGKKPDTSTASRPVGGLRR